jgi:two-component system cell cycle response regulator
MDKKTVLVVEDNDLNMKLIRSYMLIGNHHMIEAVNAESGIELARRHRPDLILMDIQLPGLDGLEATRQIRNDLDLKDIPIIALTAHAMKEDESKALASGCNDFITKPCGHKEFLDKINKFFSNNGKGHSLTAGPSHRSKILIVDDEPLNAKLLGAKLASRIYDITKAYNGHDALKQIAVNPPDLILLDVMMPSMDGYEVTRRLKEDGRTKDIPIILITALDGAEEKKKGLEAGADEFLNKPVNDAELAARIVSLLKLKKYREQLKSRKESERRLLNDAVCADKIDKKVYLPSILIVEDTENDARILSTFLDEFSNKVRIVTNGRDALEMIKHDTFDIVLLDILMPDMNGYEVCRRIKQNDETCPIQVVMVTNLTDLDSKIRGIELGADDYLVKPVNKDELRVRVNSLFKKKKYIEILRQRADSALNSAMTDDLTGIYNHSYFKHFLNLELKRSQRRKHGLALLFIDIDDFKIINDTQGHPAGDEYLRSISRLIRKNIREIDLAARYAGDEFVIVLPYADRDIAALIAKRICDRIKTQNCAQQQGPNSVSIGIALFPDHGETLGELVQNADSALYAAKKAGKGQTCFYHPAKTFDNPLGKEK